MDTERFVPASQHSSKQSKQDPMIGNQVRAARLAAGLSLRAVAAIAHVNPGYLSQIENGKRVPSEDVVSRLARALNIPDLSPVLVPSTGGGLNREAVRALADALAAQRRLEDAIGAAPLVAPTTTQLHLVTGMVANAHGLLRSEVLDVASQWAQFAGWLHIAVGDYSGAIRCLDRATDWALERGDLNMLSTTLNLRGYIAWKRGRPGAMLSLSQAAGRDRRVAPGLLAIATQQQARAHAILGDSDATDRLFDQAIRHVEKVDPSSEPPWIYFYSPAYLQLQRGRAYRLLGRHAEAAELLRAGLAELPPEMSRADWAATYREDLAAVTE
jgi:transcriptional regulator with XRE-family HTH domain